MNTQVDLMDEGTDCLGVLTNRLLPLKQGYVAVVNRGERANREGVSVIGAAARERAFFAQHPKYRLHMHRYKVEHALPCVTRTEACEHTQGRLNREGS